MKQIKTQASAILNTSAEDAYATIADYHQGHPAILPAKNLYDLRVEQGGYGAGTIIRFKARTLGVEQAFHHIVSEPEPGRRIVEEDIDSIQHLATTFTVTPVEQGKKSHVEISTVMNASPGFNGLIERLVLHFVNPAIYRKELKLLESVAQRRAVTPEREHV
jgi:hypothetical protein